ncbi:MAG: LEA type 2 family protein [Myxococcota bacterium]
MALKFRLVFAASIAVLLCGGGLLASCAALQGLGREAFKSPEISFKDVKLRDVSLAGTTLDFEFELLNPNPVAVTFATLDYQLDIDGSQFVKGESDKGVEMKANGSSTINVPLTVEFKELADSLLAFLKAKDSIAYRLQAGFGLKTPLGPLRLPVDVDGDAPVPKLPKISVQGVKLDKLDMTGAALSLAFDLENRGSFPLQIQGIDYAFQIAEVDVTSGVAEGAKLEASSQTAYTIPIALDFFKLGRSMLKVIQSKTFPYDFRGKIDLGLLEQPFELQGVAEL